MDDGDRGKPPLLQRLSNLFQSNETDETDDTADTSQAGRVPSEMRLRIKEFEAARVEDVMIPRSDIVALDQETPFDEVIDAFSEATHSRLPVYRDSLDDPMGFVHIKDVVAALSAQQRGVEDAPRSLSALRRDLLYVPTSMHLSALLVRMQSTRIHLALVVDEYGGTDGLVSLEDLVEEIVGEIEDEHDEDAPGLSAKGIGVWEADARIEIIDFTETTGIDLALPDYEDEIDTLGGIVFALAGRVPQRGEILRHPNGIDFEVLDADPRRIQRLRLRCPANLLEREVEATPKAEDQSDH